SFGAHSLDKTIVAGMVGVAVIMLLMIAIYHFAGFISSVGLMIYTFVTFLVFWVIGGTLTLPGIAALVIGIGMAVDANVISFARIKEELAKGTKLQMAYKQGNDNSFMTIFDSNFTTLIVAIILFIFGESSVK
ncbi:MAG: protein translocase subunit SecDF, partial [Erysipelotrichaceae bacterium]